MEAGHEAVDDPPGNNLNAPEGSEARGVEEIGAVAARRLLNLMEGSDAGPNPVLPTSLVVRQSA